MNSKELANQLAASAKARGKPQPSQDLLNFIGGPLQAHQEKLIKLHEMLVADPDGLTLSDVENELARIGYELNETIFYMLTNGAELSNFVEPPDPNYREWNSPG